MVQRELGRTIDTHKFVLSRGAHESLRDMASPFCHPSSSDRGKSNGTLHSTLRHLISTRRLDRRDFASSHYRNAQIGAKRSAQGRGDPVGSDQLHCADLNGRIIGRTRINAYRSKKSILTVP